MISVVIGGSGSGKSEYAEELLKEHVGDKYYLATMQVYDEESREKVRRHQELRKGKGFITIERPVSVGTAIDEISDNNPGILLECLSNLVANEMFKEDCIVPTQEVEHKVIEDIKELSRRAKHLVLVTNNVNEAGVSYDETTLEYIRAMSNINVVVSNMADRVTEVVVGIPLELK